LFSSVAPSDQLTVGLTRRFVSPAQPSSRIRFTEFHSLPHHLPRHDPVRNRSRDHAFDFRLNSKTSSLQNFNLSKRWMCPSVSLSLCYAVSGLAGPRWRYFDTASRPHKPREFEPDHRLESAADVQTRN
jgi:hypothetical protein